MQYVIDPLDPRELTEEQARAVWENLPAYLTEEHTPPWKQ